MRSAADHEHWATRMAHHPFSDTPHEHVFQAGETVGGEDNHVHSQRLGSVGDLRVGMSIRTRISEGTRPRVWL